ncbi:hypothetical protein WJX74_007225 [Apatococcus lobatus]|uniref:Uncharacterized protein n=1 Tax=Apatococcus lobatus TaxID=904363 RepID=A0AAW1RX46_9CHLO
MDQWVCSDEVQLVGPAGVPSLFFPILKGIAEERLEQFADRVQDRLLQLGKEAQLRDTTSSAFRDMVVSKVETFQQLIKDGGLEGTLSIEQVIEVGNEAHDSGNRKLHTSDAKLREDGKKLVDQGITMMLEHKQP